jgi:tRNA A37 methylthiotransferase MiaB
LTTEYFLDDNIVDRIIEEGTDILCLSVYLWNFESLMKIAREVSIKNPNIHIIVGGPECHANTEPDWFEKYPFVDFAIYGDGEKAFANILDWYIDPTETLYESIPNIVDSNYKANHEIFRFKEWEEYSPYLDLSEEFLKDYKKFKDNVDGAFVYLPYERTRGCMYSCAFCDWQSGLHYKVNTRINDYKKEIDFFARHKIRTMHIDANVGMMKEDIPLYEYVCDKMKEYDLEFIPTEPRNMAKLHKDKVSKIYDILCEASPNYNVKVSLQSIYNDVLSNIDRPDVPWVEHKEIIKTTKNKFPHIRVIPELIMGLPGMTFERILETHLEFSDIPMTHIYSYEWILLKKSPAYFPEYRKKHNLTVTKTFYPAIFTGLDISSISIEDFNKDPNIVIQKNQAYYIDMVYDSILGIKGVIYNKILTRIYNIFVTQNRLHELKEFYLNNNNRFLDAAEKEATNQLEFYNKYGFFIWGTMDDKYIRNYEITLDGYLENV